MKLTYNPIVGTGCAIDFQFAAKEYSGYILSWMESSVIKLNNTSWGCSTPEVTGSLFDGKLPTRAVKSMPCSSL